MPSRYVHNLQGDVVALVGGNGDKVVEYWYDAWGKPLSKTGSMAETLGMVQPFRYRGYVWDEETGLYYLRSRYYKPEHCRFINADELIQSNTFSYCDNSPAIGVDYYGLETIWMVSMAFEPEIASSIQDLAFYTKLKRYPIGSINSTALARIEASKGAIVDASSQTGVPITVIQAVMYRETICYGFDDALTDWMPGRSKGAMQIKAEAAQKANQYFYPTSSKTEGEIENELNNPNMNIYYGALRLAHIAAEYGVDFNKASDEQVGLVFSTYNSGRMQQEVGPYGRATLSYYKAFKRHLKEYLAQ